MDYEDFFGSSRRALATFLIVLSTISVIVVVAYRERRLLQERDLDYDGKPDSWEYDTNHDGAADLWIRLWLGLDGATKEIVTNEKDTDYDGAVDWTLTINYPTWYSWNTTRTLEEDLNHNGRIDHRIVSVDGKKANEVWFYDMDGDGLEESQQDDGDGDGRVDCQRWYYWVESLGEVVPGEPFNYVERDTDMDGRVDGYAVLLPTSGWLEVNASMLSQ